MIEINKITVFKDGFFIRASDLESNASNPLIKPYLVVFNQPANDRLAHLIAEYTHGKGEGKSSRCPEKYLIECYDKNVTLYRKVCKSLWYELTQREKRLGPGTGFKIYRIRKDKTGKDKTAGTIDDVDPRKDFIKAFIHREKDEDDNELYLWLGDYEKKNIKFETEKSVSWYDVTPPKGSDKRIVQTQNNIKISSGSEKPVSLFSNDFREYVRFECRTEDLEQNILSAQKGFHVKNTKQFKEYLIREDHNYESLIRELINEGKSVLIQGPPKVGKTRLAFEVLKSLNGYYVFSLFQSYLPKIDKLKFHILTNKKNMRLIWFIDDLHYFHENTQKMYEKLISNFDEVIVIATLRPEKLPDIPITQYLEEIHISAWLEGELKTLATKNSIPIKYQITNSPLSLIKDFSSLKKNYNYYKTSEEKVHCLHVLYYLKLLYELFESIDYKFFEDIFIYLREGLSNKDNLKSALAELEYVGFIEIDDRCISSWEIFFTEIITDKDYYKMIDDMERLIPLFVDQKMVSELNYLGLYFRDKGDINTALNICNKVIQLSPNKPWGYINRGIIFRLKSKDDSAIEDYTKAINLDPKNSDAYSNRGNAFHNKGNHDSAIEDYTKAINLDPSNTVYYLNRGYTYLIMDEYDQAFENYNIAIKIDPYHSLAYSNRGYLHNIKGEHALAIEDYSMVIKLKPNHVNAYLNRGMAYLKIGKCDSAIEDWNVATKIDPSCDFAYFNRGKAYMQKNEYGQAIIDFTMAIVIDPDNVEAYSKRGYSYGVIGEYALAIEDYSMVIKLNPNDVDAYLNRGITYSITGNQDSAIKDFNEMVKREPNNPCFLFTRSICFAKKKNKSKMLSDLKKVITIDPTTKRIAIEDEVFKEYWDDPDFKKIVDAN